MALYAFDGTWNEDEPDTDEDTNVVAFRDAYRERTNYVEGVGTRFGALGRLVGGVFGAGGRTRIEEMYQHLVSNWKAGDLDIDIIGFSRGGALAVHFAHVIGEVGIKDGEEVIARPKVRFLGLWDVVGSFGIPIDLVLDFQKINIGYDLVVTEGTEHCFHAMALNERRQTFALTRLNKDRSKSNVEELWFRGVHSDVGGGKGNTDLSDIALQWMCEKALACGLPIDAAAAAAHAGNDPLAPLGENFDPIKNSKRHVAAIDRFHPSAVGSELAVGESRSFTVRAKEKYSWSGVRLSAGSHYAFAVREGDSWKDKDMVCEADGWRSEDLPWYKEEIFELFEGRRRCPKANWFELVGSVGDDEEEFFRIGTGGADATFEAKEDGELFAFANDLRSAYGNNYGDLQVTVTRQATAGARRLKSCSEA